MAKFCRSIFQYCFQSNSHIDTGSDIDNNESASDSKVSEARHPVLSPKWRGYTVTEAVNSVISLPNSSVLFGTGEGSLLCYSCKSGKQTNRWNGHGKAITKLATNEKGCIFSSSRDLTVKMWSTQSSSHIQEFKGHHNLVISAVATNPDNTQVICTGSRDCSIALWDIDTASIIAKTSIARNLVTDICWKGDILAQTSEDKSLRLWDSRSLQVICEFSKRHQILTCCDIDGDQVVTGSGGFNGTGCEVTVWDQRKGSQPLEELRGHTGKVNKCSFITTDTSDRFLVSVSADNSIALWDLSRMTLASSYMLPYQPLCSAQVDESERVVRSA